MLTSLTFFILPLIAITAFFSVKFFMYRGRLETAIGESIEGSVDNLEEAKEMVFLFIDDVKVWLARNTRLFFHWVLHFFVIFMGLISDLTDFLYAKSRDFFLHTASREKDAVSTFWHTLKEYKKEKEEEKTEGQ
jgi:hypothetical protein